MKLLFVCARSATVLLDGDGDYVLRVPVSLRLNGVDLGVERRSVISVFDLLPDTEYTLLKQQAGKAEEILSFRTEKETYTLNVRCFGAQGDGITDDTPFLQAAILSCPEGGRVLVPAGDYRVGPLFLKSHMTLELQRGATLSLLADQHRFPIFPGVVYPTG